MNFNLQQYSGTDPSENFDSRYKARIYRYRSIGDIPWGELSHLTNERIRLIVGVPGKPLHLDALFIPRNSPDLLVLSHGALNQERITLPFFQLVYSMVPNRSESLLFIFDTTMLIDKRIFTSYYLGVPEQDLIQDYAAFISTMRAELGYERVILAGHSAGGVASLMVGSQVAGSLAIASNPFIFDEHFFLSHLEDYRAAAFSDVANVREMVDTYADRFYMRLRLRDRAEGTRFFWFVHQDDDSWKKHGTVKRLSRDLGFDPYRPIDRERDNLVLVNWDYPANPHNMPYDGENYTFIPLIDIALGKPTSFDIGAVGNQT